MTKVYEKSPAFFDTFTRKPSMQKTTHYCPGCGHGTLNKIIADLIAELGIQDQTIFVGPVGCGVFIYYYYESASVSAPHGRASAVATGVSRANPDSVTISYQGDGDLAAIGTSNAIHAANRGENMIVFFVNNNIYGMTGGQLAPTTLIDQTSTTSPSGRSILNDGFPLRMAEMVAGLEAPVLSARVAVNTPKNVRQAIKVIRKGLEAQRDKKGYAFIEVLSQCPTNWKKDPKEACEWIDDVVCQQYPLGVMKDIVEEHPSQKRKCERVEFDAIAEQLNLTTSDENGFQPIELIEDEVRFKFAGFGGQGILSLGMMVSQLSMERHMEVTWLPSYGPEMRGGVANCSVVVSKEAIGSPVVDQPNVLVALNRPSLEKFGPLVPEDGLIIYNSSLVDTVPENLKGKVYALPATDLASEAGNVKAANVVVLGFVAQKTGMFSQADLETFLAETFKKPALLELNLKAVKAGWSAAE
ncbi:2-oxoisovalerate ferredoxin oxidoreductase beta subunit [Malonomonas rubra DSM 5091]|uniref:2-oxoisovalerate ferredoxin oxidoreductase beta subunit n=1 Tax=Malonomonas rubra DSM 5091 TaxID=1122189 RepID=A0A1M6FL22_MALRU|nr:2-oxoacid:acceptor oxidoreductase family protein [Malonomonas rubra]SHI98418.1 2-oxoisovalerate ferredoxin oxidoreductase beta subunit [Malonomonas rubra DSM 5091]